ncbi:MAG: hypothetical protein CMO40_09110 [Verrucomicrobiaceae bacterium]|nr:hypothetical protein [Verrucomicrobiaceae bacterium]
MEQAPQLNGLRQLQPRRIFSSPKHAPPFEPFPDCPRLLPTETPPNRGAAFALPVTEEKPLPARDALQPGIPGT